MSKIIKTIRKALTTLFLVLGVFVVVTGVYYYYYQEQIIQKFLSESNKRLGNAIQMGAIQLTFFQSFPNISLALHDVVVKNGIESSADLVTARRIYCTFDMWKLIQGEYLLSHLHVEHGKLHLEVDMDGQLRWETGVPGVVQYALPLSVELQRIYLKNMEIVCGSGQQYYVVNAAQIQASMKWEDSGLEAELQGKATIQRIQLKDLSFAQNIPLSLRAAMSYNPQQKTWTLKPTQFSHGRSVLTVQGSWGLEAASSMAFTVQGKKISPQLLLRCLPQQYYQQIKSYDLCGELTLDLGIHRHQCKFLAVQGDFIFSDGALSTSQFSSPIELCQLSGHLSIPNVQNLKTAALSIDKITGMLAGSRLEGSVALRDFHNLRLQCTAKAMLDLASLSVLFVHPTITDASGQLGLYWNLEANLQQLIRGANAQENLCLSGALQAHAAQFKLGPSQLPCKDLIGNFIFQDNALVMQDFSGSMGPGSFVLNGTVHNLLPHLLSDNQKLCVDAKLYMDYLDLDIIPYGKRETTFQTSQSLPKFNIAPHWALNLDCDIQQLHFRRFQGKNVCGKVKVQKQKLIAEKLQLGVAGGKVFLDSVLDARTNDFNIHTSARLRDVQIAPFFYMFENFHQHLLTDRHLSGEVFSNVDLTIQADKQWNLNWDALQATIDFKIIDGGLHDFEPLQQLAKYVDKEEDLSKVRFSELKNQIFIENQTIRIPPMEIHSNLTRIQLSGIHTFGGKVAYNFGVPFTGLRKTEIGWGSEEVRGDSLEGISLFFKLRGDVNNYEVSYDAEASQASFKGELKKQGDILKSILQGRYRKKEQIKELNPDDYFEFDE